MSILPPDTPPESAHDAVHELLGVAALGHLDAADEAIVTAHARGCVTCRRELDALRPLAAPLAALDPDEPARPVDPDAGDPSPGGFDAIRARIRAETDAGPEAGSERSLPPAPRLRPGRPALSRRFRLAAAAAVVALAAGGLGSLLGPGTSSGPSADPVAVQALAPDIRATAGVVPHTWGMEVKLDATGFERGRPYRAGVLDRAGNVVSAGEFVGTGDTEMHCNLNSSVLRDQATGFVVTDVDGRPVLRAGLA